MIEDYRENLLSDVMRKVGTDLFNRNTTVVIKRDFCVNEFSMLKAGTIGYLKQAKSYEVVYGKDSSTYRLTFSTPGYGDLTLFCNVPDNGSVMVSGLKNDIELKELFTIADAETSRTVEKYYALREKYTNKSCTYRKKVNIASGLCYIIASAVFLIGLMAWIGFGSTMLGIATLVFSAIMTVIGAALCSRDFNDTKAGKSLNCELDDISDEISRRDAESCRQFAV